MGIGVEASLAGALLVASPALDDPNFARTVILLLDHDDDGAVGVVLNRPTDVAAGTVVPRSASWSHVASQPAVVHIGGPVAADAVVCLGRMRSELADGAGFAGWAPVGGAVGAIDLDGEAAALFDALDAFRVFAGYAGWDAGQLEYELRLGGWLVLAAHSDDAFSADPATLWSRVLRRQGGELAMLHTMPADPTNN